MGVHKFCLVSTAKKAENIGLYRNNGEKLRVHTHIFPSYPRSYPHPVDKNYAVEKAFIP